uniref:Uncharacterized protein n=1 Tax=Picea glauca TaxID=3330 RepID=A0A124GNB6_PICGL|nr:hypothetical protein ABT39_MTgene5293 [Picea glauca]QHR88868.1 hypothetical protein Q903MT_gene2887 [Picea sitchensis]
MHNQKEHNPNKQLLDRLLNLLVLLVLLRLALLALGLDLILEGMALEMEGILSEVVKQSPVFLINSRRKERKTER